LINVSSVLQEILKKRRRKTVGLMSGTSVDGLDLSYCDVDTSQRTLRNLHSLSIPYSAELKDRILAIAEQGQARLAELAALHTYLGHFYAASISRLFEEASVSADEVDLIGSHGQTIAHLAVPSELLGSTVRGTLQIGEAEVIAKRTGVITVSDFRQGDIAVDGCGAPLTPLYHWSRFSDPHQKRIVVNIGGISNITYLAEGACTATDAGPGNCLVDQTMRLLFHREYDCDGKRALQGKVNKELLQRLQSDLIFQRRFPLSLDRKETVELLQRKAVKLPEHEDEKSDMITTLSELTTWAIHFATLQLSGGEEPDKVLLCGGGALNRYFVARLESLFANSVVETTQNHGSDPKYVEAEAFAYLANLTLDSATGNLPQVTGSIRPAILGKISQP